MIRALTGMSVLILVVGCSGAPAGSGGAANPGGAPAGDPGECAFEATDDAREAVRRLDELHQELIGELEADLDEEDPMEDQQEIYAAMATIDEGCLAAYNTIGFPDPPPAAVNPARSALEDVAVSRRAAADAATEEEFEAAVADQADAFRDWLMWRNTLLLQLR